MLEKWLLVFLIVGGTSLVFIICFPIDFYLYRRRKRQARERNNVSKPVKTTRAAQYRAPQISVDITEEYTDDIGNKLTQARESFKRENSFVRLLSLFRRKKKEEQLMQMRRLNESKSEHSSELPVVTLTSDTLQTMNMSSSDSTSEQDHKPTSDSYNSTEQSNSNAGENVKLDNEQVVNIESQVQGVGKETICKIDCEDSMVITNTVWGEYDELMDHENKHLNYGAFQTFEDIHYHVVKLQSKDSNIDINTSSINNTAQNRNECFVLDDYVSDNETQTDMDDVEIDHLHKHFDEKSVYTDDLRSNLNIIQVKSEKVTDDSELTDNDASDRNIEIEDCATYHATNGDGLYSLEKIKERNSVRQSDDKVIWSLDCKDTEHSCTHSININRRQIHSYSDQCLTSPSLNSYVPFLFGRKRNSITPTDDDVKPPHNDITIEDITNNENTLQRALSVTESYKSDSNEQTGFKANKKKSMSLQNNTVHSLPSLPAQHLNCDNMKDRHKSSPELNHK